MTSAFSWQSSISLCPASFCTPRSNFPVTPGVYFFLFFIYYLFIYIFITSFFFFLFVVNFVIHLNETAMGLHVFPIPPPTSLST